ncbi:MAG: SAM-dependent methyltransferase [Nitrososphaerales archaeon]
MSTTDPFGRPDLLDESTLDALVARFEARAAHPAFSRMLHEYLDAMQIDDASSVLDVGCGTGAVARAIVKRPRFSGRVAGVDLSPHLVAAAQRLAAQEGVAERTDFRAGDERDLGTPEP